VAADTTKDGTNNAASGVRLSVGEHGPAIIHIDLDSALTLVGCKQIRASVAEQVEALEGRPFAILMDTRNVTSVEDGALDELQGLEKDSAGLGLERVAHVVRFAELKGKLDEEYRQMGYPNLIGTFTDASAALIFLRGE
jgi:hypothetical protein